MLEMAIKLGFSGIAFADFDKVSPKSIKNLRKKYRGKCKIFIKATIIPENTSLMKERIKKLRNIVDFIAIRTKTKEKNIYLNAIIDKRVDMITLSDLNEFAALGFAHFRMARENSTYIEVSIRNLLDDSIQKSKAMRIMNKACYQLIRAKTPFIISSGARSKWELRAPSELIALSGLIGIPEQLAQRALSEYPGKLITRLEMIRDPSYVMAGVRVIAMEKEKEENGN